MSLSTSSNTIESDEVSEALVRLKLHARATSLLLADAEIDDAELATLAAALKAGVGAHLVTISLQRNRIIDPSSIIEDMPASLNSLILSRNRIACAGVSTLAAALSARGVSTPKTSLGHGLTVLDLSRNRIACAGVLALTKSVIANTATSTSRLRVLRLRDNDVGAAGAAALGEATCTPNCALQELDLGANSLGDEGALALAKTLPLGSSLERLWLDMNDIQPSGGVALAAAVGGGGGATRLAFLSAVDNVLGDVGVRALAAAASTSSVLNEVRLRGNGSSLAATSI